MDSEFEPKPNVREFEKDVSSAIINDIDHLDFLDSCFFSENDKTKLTMSPLVKNHIPTHCDMRSLSDLAKTIPDDVEANYNRLKKPAPSIHFPLDPTFFEYPEATGKLSEETLVLNLLNEIHLASIGFSENPAFHFLLDICMHSSKLSLNEKALSIFKTGYPDNLSRSLIAAEKKNEFRNFIEKKN